MPIPSGDKRDFIVSMIMKNKRGEKETGNELTMDWSYMGFVEMIRVTIDSAAPRFSKPR